jgi:hypothetical protein
VRQTAKPLAFFHGGTRAFSYNERAMKYTGYCCLIRFLNGKIIQIAYNLNDFADWKIFFFKLRIVAGDLDTSRKIMIKPKTRL